MFGVSLLQLASQCNVQFKIELSCYISKSVSAFVFIYCLRINLCVPFRNIKFIKAEIKTLGLKHPEYIKIRKSLIIISAWNKTWFVILEIPILQLCFKKIENKYKEWSIFTYIPLKSIFQDLKNSLNWCR